MATNDKTRECLNIRYVGAKRILLILVVAIYFVDMKGDAKT